MSTLLQEGVILHLAELSENLLKCLQSRSFLPSLLPSVLHKSRHAPLLICSQHSLLVPVWITDMEGRQRCLITAQSSLSRLPRHRPRCGLQIYSKGASVQQGVLTVDRQTPKENSFQWVSVGDGRGCGQVKRLITWQEDELSEHTLVAWRQRSLDGLLLSDSRFETRVSQRFSHLSPTLPSGIRDTIPGESHII